jgi:hypothetical protein
VATAAAHAQQAPASPATKPDYLPESFWDATKGEPKADDLKKFWADRDAARAAVPDKPEGYKLELPPDVKLPDGFEPNPKETKFVGLQKIAHEDGLSQATLNKIVRLEAEAVSAAHANVQRDIAARDKALGENGAARVTALAAFIDSHWSDPKEARQIKDTMWTPVIVKHFETYQKMVTGQGAHSFTQTGRDGAPEPNDGKPPGWEKTSPENKRAWFLRQQREAATQRH